jgi:hypothetical protein
MRSFFLSNFERETLKKNFERENLSGAGYAKKTLKEKLYANACVTATK